ncbi:MAG: hypothetical protein CVV02_06550 [Firmicutes bacterium HGW-Firmicutes-7]|nr:MAG: hypothetical protein CVV02_06550 [Firmicutes bacterium HGW-Firmicutes-7]
MMKNIEYKLYEWEIERDLSSCYLVLRVGEGQVEDYQVKMLQNNVVPNILEVHTKNNDGDSLVLFSIGEKTSLFDYIKENSIGYELLRNIIETLIDTISSAHEFFLNEANFQLDGNFIFVDTEKNKCFYVYVPCKNENESNNFNILKSLVDRLIKRVHKNDERAISLVHKFRMVLEENSFNILILKEVIKYEDNIQFVEPLMQMDIIGAYDNEQPVTKTKHQSAAKQNQVAKDSKMMFIVLQVFIGAALYLCSAKLFGVAESHSSRLIKVIVIIGVVSICEVIIFFKVLFQKKRVTNETTTMITKEKNMKGMIKLDKKEKAKKNLPKKVKKESNRVKWQWERPINNLSEPMITQKRAYWVDECEVNIPLLNTPFIIGKMKGVVDYQIKNERVSRIHCQITYEEENYYITDLNSKEGTFLNNTKLEGQAKYLLKNTDEINIIDEKYYFKLC